MKPLLKPLFLLLILTLLLPACTPTSSTETHSTLRRITSPDVDAAAVQQLAAGNTAFALDLYQALKTPDANLFYSPYSLSLALAMTYAGARGNTETQMAQVLHFPSQDTLHPAFNALDLALTARANGKKAFELTLANSLWGQQDYVFEPAFLDTLAANYGAGLRLTDFAHAPDPARVAINDWVSDQTQDRINDLIPEGAIDSLTRLVLANAIYFNAQWVHPFAAESTSDAPFNLLTGETINVPMMRMEEPVPLAYGQGAGYQAVELPYQGEQISMLIIVPDAGTFPAFEGALTPEQYTTLVNGLTPQMVNLILPKFTFATTFSLSDTLAGMGMPDAFDPDLADFSGMDGTTDLYIAHVFHKAFVAVDEAGTEAAAASAVVMNLESARPMEGVVLFVDRPFLFFIRDMETGTILFAGRVVAPEAGG
ncbi:MAG: serpin family protein [Anaerolineales bacterium]|nr:serpin family protein [Anaerolineales bacterium]